MLVGAWASTDKTREYKLERNGSFSLRFDPQSCAGPASSSKQTTASGRWKLEGTILAFTVDDASDELLRGSTMRETLVTVEPNALVLESSVALCASGSVEKVQLRKQ